jgi:ribosome-associated protein
VLFTFRVSRCTIHIGVQAIKPRDIAAHCARIADEKKAEDITVLDIRKLTFITDYFVIASGFNKRQLQAIADDIEKWMKNESIRCFGREGYNEAIWILLDYGDVVIHLFDEEARRTYDLEMLWGDAPRVRWKARARKKAEPPSTE